MVVERQDKDDFVGNDQARDAMAEFFAQNDYAGKRILVIIPDNTRSGPIGEMFKLMYEFLGPKANTVDCLVALGTHHAMSAEQICARLSMTPDERETRYAAVKFFNHEWDKPDTGQQDDSRIR
jgi:nickel-dependent lactate racemase